MPKQEYLPLGHVRKDRTVARKAKPGLAAAPIPPAARAEEK